MRQRLIRRGRPVGTITVAVIDALRLVPRSRRHLTQDLQMSFGLADQVLDNLRRRAEVQPVACEWPRSGSRPAMLYAPAEPGVRSAAAFELSAVFNTIIQNNNG